MAINIKFDTAGNPEPPTIILATKNGDKLGLLNINADSIELNDKLKVSEISFTLNKYIDGKLNNLWDKVVDFKLIWCKEWDLWFEIKVELDETTETIKTVFCTQLGQAELSQIMVYNMEVNTEEDIARDDYKITILYDENDHKVSLLHRLLKDKAPHYSIAYVDPTIARIQRQFSWDGSSICDVLDEIEEEIGCLVVYNSNSTKGGMPNRSISVYDLEQNCKDCGHRGEFTDKCPKCGSKNIKYGYGEDTTIFVTNDELASDGIQLVVDTDSVKNCFKLEAGDDLMTATIRNCNPNGSDYIWRFSEDIKNDMSKELVKKLESYDDEYKIYYDKYESNLDTTLLTRYNNLVEKYDDFYNTNSTCLNCKNEGKFYDKCPSCGSENLLTGKELQKISTPIVGYPSLMNAYYNTIDFSLYLESGLMPSITMSDTTAEEQLKLLTSYALSPVAVNVENINNVSLTTANSAVLSMAKILIRPTYKIEIKDSELSDNKQLWRGRFVVTNYSDETDTAINNYDEYIEVIINNNAEEFIKQKIEKALNKENTDDLSVSGLFNEEKYNYTQFCNELKKYALNSLKSFYESCDVCLSILIEQGAGNEDEKPDLYKSLYEPYYNKSLAIAKEIKTREEEVTIIAELQENIIDIQSRIQDALNFEDYLGKDLWMEFCSFRREDKYSNSNYISDGLNNAQLFEKALEFLDVAENEIYKSSELQHSISTSLKNLLAIDKFKPLVKYFKNGNWIRVRVDDKIYKLRLLEYSINFGSFESISVEFSDVIKIKNGITDVKNVIEQASSMATSYDAVTRQAKKGNVAKGTIEQWIDEGLNAANVQITNNDSEEILITKNGLLGRSYDDITGTYSPEQVKLTHNIMAYTDDNWETVKQAIGKHKYSAYDKELGKIIDDKIGYGMSAEFVTAGVVSGSQIIGGDIYSDNYSVTNSSGSYLNLRDGTFSFGGGSLRFEKDKDGNAQLLISSPDVLTKNEITTINEEYLKTTSVYAENLQVNSAKIQGKLTASQIDVDSLNADDIIGTTITGKTIKSSDFIGGYLLIGDENKVNDYAEIAEDGTLTCTNVSIQGGILQMGSKENDETHTWIDSYGTLNTYNANISGEIRASKGSIGGFTIETTETDDEGNKSGGWLYSGANIGDDKSIFLSATDMSGTVSQTTLFDWRLTVGEHFGVASDGTTYMSNCEITGGSLRMGTENDGYHTWISYEGVLNANGVNISGSINAIDGNIGGWLIDGTEICSDSTDVGLSSGSIHASSLVSYDESPIRIYAGKKSETFTINTSGTLNTLGILDKTVIVSQTGGKIKSVDIKSLSFDKSLFSICSVTFSNSTISTIRIKLQASSLANQLVDIELEYVYQYDDISECNTIILEDGSLYANAAQIKGHIEATSGSFTGEIKAETGNIGGLKIDNGIKGYSGAIETISLTNEGLSILNSNANIQVGNLNAYYDGTTTYWQTNGALRIQGMQSQNVITEIALMTDTGSASVDIPVYMTMKSGATSSDKVNIQLNVDEALYTSHSFIIYYQTAKAVLFGSHEYDDDPKTFTLTINAGETASEEYTISINTLDSGLLGTFIRLSVDGINWHFDTEVRASLSETATVSTISNQSYNQNLVITGNMVSSTAEYTLGLANKYWKGAFLGSSTIVTSDRSCKNTIQELSDEYSIVFDSLIPVTYKYNDGDSDRLHTGFVAQDVKNAIKKAGLTTQDMAAYCEWNNNDGSTGCALRYEEFIALCVDQIQKLKKHVKELEDKIQASK